MPFNVQVSTVGVIGFIGMMIVTGTSHAFRINMFNPATDTKATTERFGPRVKVDAVGMGAVNNN